MGIKTQKVLRFISKTVLLVVGLVLIGYVGLVVYKSIVNKPQKVRVTNVTNSAATITWVTDNPVRGVVYYNTKDSVLPGPLGFLFSNVAYDDRDFAVAQKDCVNDFNENAKNTKDENFAVSGSNFDCENIKVEKLGAYYTHSVTLKNLDESGKYFFKVGNGILSWGINGVGKDINENDLPLATKFELSTGVVPTTIPTPNIAYGNVYAAEMIDDQVIAESQSKDSLVFAYLTIGGVNSQPVSAVTNDEGGWILDKSNFRDTEGNLITDLSSASMVVCSQYEHTDPKVCLEVLEDLDKDTNVDLLGNIVDDLGTYEKNKILEKFEQLVGKVYATGDYDMNRCNASGYTGCAADGGCIKKCPLAGTNLYDWVRIADYGESGCSMPYSCGCSPRNGCEPRCSSGSAQHRTCSDTGGYNAWTAWSAGRCPDNEDPCDVYECLTDDDCGGDKVCTSHKCVDSGGGDVYCNDGGMQIIEGGYCPSNNRRCSHNGKCDGAVNGGGGGNVVTIGGDCSPENSESTANSVPVICLGGTWKKLVRCTDSKGTPYKENSCHYLTNTSSEKCISKDSSPYWQWKQYPNAGKCDLPVPTCTVKPKYHRYVVGDCELLSCDLVCDGKVTASYNTPGSCRAQYPNIAESYPFNNNCESSNNDATINIENIDINSLSTTELKRLLALYPTLRATIVNALAGILSQYDNRECKGNNLVLSGSPKSKADKFCQVLTGHNVTDERSNDFCPAEQGGTEKRHAKCAGVYGYTIDFVSKAYAAEDAAAGYTLYLPEYGMYSFELGDYNITTDTNNGNTYYIFYIESNGVDGFQMPADPDNPTAEEDIMLKSNSAAITYEKLSSAQKYVITKGINLVSFNFVPVSTELGAYTAADVISQATKNGVTIQYISTFDGGRWNNGYSCTSTPCTGNNFTIVPGKGYLVYATTGGNITIPGYNLTSSVPVAFSAGWNLVGVHGYTTAYTARSFIDSINTVKGLTANNVSWWPTSKSKYEGLQVDNGTEYGLDFPISPNNGYFVRISNFAPEDAKCKSLIWQIGGKLNGTCGNTK